MSDPTPTSHRRPERHANWALRLSLAVLLIASGAVIAGFRYYDWCQGASGERTPVSFTIERGASGAEVVDRLHELGVIRCGTVSKWLLRRSGKADAIRAGTYALTTNMTPDDAFTVISTVPPPVREVRLTIPEGYRLTEIAERVQDDLKIPSKRFLAAVDDGHWSLPPYLPRGKPLEGFLFPQTYEFAKGETTPDDVIRRLLGEFGTEARQLPWSNAKKLGLSPYEVVIVASMIEEEAKIERDRPLIAGVIYNRLDKGMTLGIDATLLYDDPTPGNGLTESDLRSTSPYNTRLHTGLPPTPIASPGLASLEAALEPAHTQYLYYVLCGADGHHQFSVSYDRFLQDKARCLG